MSEPVGTVGEEAARLFEAVQDWMRGAATEQPHPVAAECRICPVCALLGVLRTARPEVFDHLVDATGSLLAAFRVALEAHERHWARRRGAPVERIDLAGGFDPAGSGAGSA
jgi:hypothetical protein